MGNLFRRRNTPGGRRGLLFVALMFVFSQTWADDSRNEILPAVSSAPEFTEIIEVMEGKPLSEYRVSFSLEDSYEPYGPIAHKESDGACVRFSLSPLFTVERNPDLETIDMDFLYPFFGVDRFGREYRVHFGQIINWAGGQDNEDRMTRRYNLFPILFYQRSEVPDNDYWAVMPIYGHLKNRMWRDEFNFVMAPLYIKTRKRDMITRNYLFPIVHVREGDRKGWQVWPFAGRERKEFSVETDKWGDEVVVEGHLKEFYLWPIGIHHEKGIGTENPEEFTAVLPFYAQTRSPNRDYSVVMWPFFNWVDDREKGYREWGMPYPFVVFARGEGKTTDRILPFYGNSYSSHHRRQFVMWPVWKKTYYEGEKFSRERDRILFYLYSDVTEKLGDNGKKYRRTDGWPLFSAKMASDNTYSVRMLSPFEPFYPGNESVEKNWTPAVSIWSLDENKDRGQLRESLFWNLYRHEENKKQERWSGFFGLVERVKDKEYGNYWRIFYSPDKRRTAEKKARQQTEREP